MNVHVHTERCLHVHRVSRRDPTRTTTVRRRWEAEVSRRFRELRRLVRRAIVELDVLGLQDPPQALAANQDRPRRIGHRNQVSLPAPRAFQFERPGQKVAAFMDWLVSAAYDGILDTTVGTPVRSAAQTAWTNTYIQTAYQKGLVQAGSRMRREGVEVSERWIDSAFMRPVHADRAGLIFTRAFEELVGITDEMSRQMSRVLAQGIAEGRGVMDIARSLEGRVDKIGRTRARTLARTEVIAAHADASLNAYEEAGLEGVGVEAEWATAGDGQVCPECQAMEGRTFTIAQARGMIPLHPNCRCAFIPVVLDARGVRLD